jgi:hypothetical protein
MVNLTVLWEESMVRMFGGFQNSWNHSLSDHFTQESATFLVFVSDYNLVNVFQGVILGFVFGPGTKLLELGVKMCACFSLLLDDMARNVAWIECNTLRLLMVMKVPSRRLWRRRLFRKQTNRYGKAGVHHRSKIKGFNACRFKSSKYYSRDDGYKSNRT